MDLKDADEFSDSSDDDFGDDCYVWEDGNITLYVICLRCKLIQFLFLTDYGLQTRGSGANPNQQTSTNKVLSFQPQEKMLKKFASKINVDEFKLTENPNDDKLRVKDKKDRATAEQVMDPRTRMILFKLMNRGFITQINGCISTGKEANVYHATGKDDSQLALKIYKTSILVFKDRDKYVTGEFR